MVLTKKRVAYGEENGEQDVHSLRYSDVIYKQNKSGLRDFLSLANKSRVRDSSETARRKKPLKIGTARLMKFDEIFARPIVFEGPFATPMNSRLQLVFKLMLI